MKPHHLQKIITFRLYEHISWNFQEMCSYNRKVIILPYRRSAAIAGATNPYTLMEMMASFRCCRATDFGCSRTLRESVAWSDSAAISTAPTSAIQIPTTFLYSTWEDSNSNEAQVEIKRRKDSNEKQEQRIALEEAEHTARKQPEKAAKRKKKLKRIEELRSSLDIVLAAIRTRGISDCSTVAAPTVPAISLVTKPSQKALSDTIATGDRPRRTALLSFLHQAHVGKFHSWHFSRFLIFTPNHHRRHQPFILYSHPYHLNFFNHHYIYQVRNGLQLHIKFPKIDFNAQL